MIRLVLYDYQGLKVREHVGGWMNSIISLIPDKNLGICIATNAYFSDLNPRESLWIVSSLKLKIIDSFLGLPDKDWSTDFLRICIQEHKKE